MTDVVKRSVLVIPKTVSSPAFHSILGKVKSVLEGRIDNEGALFTSLSTIMQVIEESDVNTNKKVLAENVLKQLILDSDLDDNKEKILLSLIESDVVGNTIDLVISASRGDMTLNVAAKEAAKGCLRLGIPKLLNMFCVPKRPSLPAPKTTVTKLQISELIPDEDKLPDLPNEVFEPETKENSSNTEPEKTQLTPTLIETDNV